MHEELDGSSADWTPAFPGQRPPFEPGNTVALQHGAFSPRFVDPLAAELVGMVLEDPQVGYLTAPAYRPALWAWARAEAQAQLLVEYLARAGQESGDGVGDLDLDRVRTAYLLLHRAESRADRSRARLGLDPLSRARLGKDVAQAKAADAAAIMAELHRLEQQGQMHAVHAPGRAQEAGHTPAVTDAHTAATDASGAGQ